MGRAIIKSGFILILYFLIIGIVCPYLVSARDNIEVISGFVLILLTAATVPSVVKYIFRGAWYVNWKYGDVFWLYVYAES